MAMFNARVSGLPLPREPALDGDDESGTADIGGGGNVVGLGESDIGSSPPYFGMSSVIGESTLRSRSGRLREVISVGSCQIKSFAK